MSFDDVQEKLVALEAEAYVGRITIILAGRVNQQAVMAAVVNGHKNGRLNHAHVCHLVQYAAGHWDAIEVAALANRLGMTLEELGLV